MATPRSRLVFSFGLLLAACASPDASEDDAGTHRGWRWCGGRGRSGGHGRSGRRGRTRRQHRRGRQRAVRRARAVPPARADAAPQHRHGRHGWWRGRGRSGRRGWRGGNVVGRPARRRGRTRRQRRHRHGGARADAAAKVDWQAPARRRGGRAAGTGAGGATAPCAFASGLNAAWVSFANDVPNPNMTAFQTMFRNTQMAGGRIVRWWFHTNGTVTPGYNSSGMANPLSQSAITGLTSLLNLANTNGVKLVISLWSFDMLQGGQNISTTLRNNNRNLLTMDANRQAYIDNVLTPLVNAVKGNPGLYAWEIFNEPEGMTTEHGWTADQGGTDVGRMYIYRTINWLAAAIHTADPSARVTSGAWTFQVSSTRNFSGGGHFYSNSSLMAAGGKANGTVDFYEVHYYMLNGSQYSPFLDGRNPTYWGLTDKRVVMGGFTHKRPTASRPTTCSRASTTPATAAPGRGNTRTAIRPWRGRRCRRRCRPSTTPTQPKLATASDPRRLTCPGSESLR